MNTALPSIPRWAALWFRKALCLYWSAEISVRAGRSGVVLLIFLLSALPENKHFWIPLGSENLLTPCTWEWQGQLWVAVLECEFILYCNILVFHYVWLCSSGKLELQVPLNKSQAPYRLSLHNLNLTEHWKAIANSIVTIFSEKSCMQKWDKKWDLNVIT